MYGCPTFPPPLPNGLPRHRHNHLTPVKPYYHLRTDGAIRLDFWFSSPRADCLSQSLRSSNYIFWNIFGKITTCFEPLCISWFKCHYKRNHISSDQIFDYNISRQLQWSTWQIVYCMPSPSIKAFAVKTFIWMQSEKTLIVQFNETCTPIVIRYLGMASPSCYYGRSIGCGSKWWYQSRSEFGRFRDSHLCPRGGLRGRRGSWIWKTIYNPAASKTTTFAENRLDGWTKHGK